MICPASYDDREAMTPDILLSRKYGFLPFDGILTPHAVPCLGQVNILLSVAGGFFESPKNILLSVAGRTGFFSKISYYRSHHAFQISCYRSRVGISSPQNILLSVAQYPTIGRGSRQKYPTIGRAISYYRSRVGHFDAQISYYRSRVRSKTELRFNTLQPFLGP